MIIPSEASITDALKAGVVTFRALCSHHQMDMVRPDRRLIDTILQRMREHGKIHYRRDLGRWCWGRQ